MARRRRQGEPRARGSAIHDGLVGARALVGTPYLADPELRREYARDIAPRTRAALAQDPGRGVPGGHGGARAGARPGRGHGRGRRGAARAFRRRPRGRRRRSGRRARRRRPPIWRSRCRAVERALRPHRRRAPAGRALRRPPARRARRCARAARARLGGRRCSRRAGRSSSSSRRCARRRASCWRCATSCWRCRDLEIVAPCFWTGACPALARERDWCHDAAAGAVGRRASTSATWCCATAWRPTAGPAALPHRQRSAAREGTAQAVRLRPHRPPRLHPARPPRVARRTPRSRSSSAATSPASPATSRRTTACASRRRPRWRGCRHPRARRLEGLPIDPSRATRLRAALTPTLSRKREREERSGPLSRFGRGLG